MILKRGDFYRHYNSGLMKLTDDLVLAYPKPAGALCRVHRVGDTTSLINGEYRFVNSELGKYLTSLGIEGEVLIHHLTNSRNVPKWLTYHHHHTDFDIWSKEIKLYVFGQAPQKIGSIPIESIHPLWIKASDIKEMIDTLSNDAKFDGLLINADTYEGPQRYFMVPTRYCEGIVSSVFSDNGKYKIIVDINYNGDTYTTVISSMTNTMRSSVEGDHSLLIGKRMKIQYTTFVPGDRLRNFSSPVGLFIID